jgi:tetratricopeptide (TPR) repeat protein
VLGRRHRETAVTLHALGKVAQAAGDYPTARRYFLEDLEITEAVLGRRHRETAVTLHALGNLAQEEGDYPTARRYFLEDLEITEAVLGRRHRETAVTLHALGNLAQEEGDYPTARCYYEEALAIKDDVLGRRHFETFITRFSRGWLVWKAIWETAVCAVLTWFVLPDQIALIGAGLVLVLGAIGYFRWRQATGVVRVLWRIQVGWLVTLLFLNLLAPATVDLSPVVVYALAAGGAALGLFWPRLMALPALRNARLRGRRWLYRGLQRLRALRRR